MKRSELLALAETLERDFYNGARSAAILRQIAEAEPVAWLYKLPGTKDPTASTLPPEKISQWNDIASSHPLYTLPLED